jgi:hypothetical protein
MTAVMDSPLTDEVEETESGPVAHIVRTEPGESAAALVLRSRIEGIPLVALCGHTWVASRDPLQLPLCPTCEEIYDLEKMMNEHLSDRPKD